jgi:hypothetical protein
MTKGAPAATGAPSAFTDGSNRLADINAIAVWILKDKGTQAIVFVLEAFDDLQASLLHEAMQMVDVLDHHMRDIEVGRLVVLLKGKMHFGIVALQDHEADGTTILEDLSKSEQIDIEGLSALHVLDGQGRGNAPEPEGGLILFSHG